MKKIIILSIAFLLGCSQSLTSGSSSSSSSSCTGEIEAPPTLPTKLGSKFQVKIDQIFKPTLLSPLSLHSQSKKENPNVLPKGTELVATVDYHCSKQKQNNAKISSTLVNNSTLVIQNSKGGHQIRHQTWKTPKSYSINELKSLTEKDPCLLMLSNQVYAFPFARHVPNDTYFSNQEYLELINAPEAWSIFYGSGGITQDVVVAIIDDGNQISHPDIANLLWTNDDEIPSNGIDDDSNGYVDDYYGYNFASNIADPNQQSGKYHGTHVMGLVGAQENNSVGVSGVMGRKIKFMSLNIFGTNAGASAANINNAIDYARNNGAHVINMSIGGSGTSAATNTAMQNAVAAGLVIAIAAGNDSAEITSGNFVYPVGYAKDINGALGVGSVDGQTGALSSFSNYSTSYVEIAAPGSDSEHGGVLSTYPTNTYSYLQGTSMASPVVAGALALAVGMSESLGLNKTPAQIEQALVGSADTSNALTSYIKGGKLLNLFGLATSLSSCP